MAYITREDGEHFVIPSYRDVLSAKKQSLLRREILALSSNYGEYITLQRKNINQYELAFSPEPGYLLGESVWNFFKRPQDLIYCEQIPNTFEAILVIVKSGSVYLDGTFPIDVIVEELIVFRTQQNYFDIYIHGDVPISEYPEEGKFAFDSSSVKSFTVLPEAIFPTLPTPRAFQLQLVDNVLKAKGIGVFPMKALFLVIAGLVGLWWLWSYLTTHKRELPQVIMRATDPYQSYYEALMTPAPSSLLIWIKSNIQTLFSIPGWVVDSITFKDNVLNALVKSEGATTHLLFDWARHNNAMVSVENNGFHVIFKVAAFGRPMPATINKIDSVLAAVVDSIAAIMPGNHLQVTESANRGKYIQRQITITFNNITIDTFGLIAFQLKNLPLVLNSVSIKVTSPGFLSGSIELRALGN
jgi:hypothetical protein